MKKTNRTERLYERLTPKEKTKLLTLLDYLREQERINQIEVKELKEEDYYKKNNITNISGVGIQKP